MEGAANAQNTRKLPLLIFRFLSFGSFLIQKLGLLSQFGLRESETYDPRLGQDSSKSIDYVWVNVASRWS